MTPRTPALMICCGALFVGCGADRADAQSPASVKAPQESIASDCSGTRNHDYFGKNCPNRQCQPVSIHVPACPLGTSATSVGVTRFEHVEPGQVIRVSGLLRQARSITTKMHCDSDCCNQSEAILGVYDTARTDAPHVVLQDAAFSCHGYASPACCKVDAICGQVVATGRYEPGSADDPEGAAPRMRDVSLCVLELTGRR